MTPEIKSLMRYESSDYDRDMYLRTIDMRLVEQRFLEVSLDINWLACRSYYIAFFRAGSKIYDWFDVRMIARPYPSGS